jgi:hypothetical protein
MRTEGGGCGCRLWVSGLDVNLGMPRGSEESLCHPLLQFSEPRGPSPAFSLLRHSSRLRRDTITRYERRKQWLTKIQDVEMLRHYRRDTSLIAVRKLCACAGLIRFVQSLIPRDANSQAEILAAYRRTGWIGLCRSRRAMRSWHNADRSLE